ncbi:MAG: hypothetical protein WC348_03810 [Patescibacteria group bacterium]|jgi:hypothetical protein
MKEIQKPVCPHCGAKAECFRHQTASGVLLLDKYTLWCSNCNKQEMGKIPAGHHINGRDYPQRTTCPFCGRPSGEHRRGLSEEEVIRLRHRREEAEESLPAPEDFREEPAAQIEPTPRAIMVLKPMPAAQQTAILPPRTKKGNRTMRTVKKIMDRMTRWSTTKLMTIFTIVYTLVLGTLVFTTKLWDEAPVGAALQVTMFSISIVAAWMTICSVLIVRYSRRFESPLLKHQGDGQ